MTSQSSLSEEELVEKLRAHLRKAGVPFNEAGARKLLDAIGLSSILSQLEAAEGERDRLREAARTGLAALLDWQAPKRHEAISALRAALSTGDRQERTFGGTGAVVLPESADGHKSEGGSPC